MQITILAGVRPPPIIDIKVDDETQQAIDKMVVSKSSVIKLLKPEANKVIEELIPKEYLPGYVSHCIMWGVIWVVKDAKAPERKRRTKVEEDS